MSVELATRPEQRTTPLERLEALCDPGSLNLLRTGIRSQRMGERARAGDGVIGGSGRVENRPVLCFAQDPSFAGGSLGAPHAGTIVQILRLARRGRIPVIGFIESAGARLQEGLAALGGYGLIFREHIALSGVVPQISVICGTAAGGGSYAPALTDFVIMAGRANMFLTGPKVVARVTGEEVDEAALGGPRVHERNGVCHMVAPTAVDGALLARELLEYLPQNSAQPVRRRLSMNPSPPPAAPDASVPSESRRVYDVRDVARALVDDGRVLEISPQYARNVVCAFAHIDGRSVGIVANQPRHLGGVLDSDASQKAARFVRTCDRFGVPLVVLVDTPGFLPGTKQERLGVIRHGAKLVHAFGGCEVARVTVILRKAFGGAFIAMNSRELGADYVFAWPDAQLGVMDPRQAVEIINRREIAMADDPERAHTELAAAYAREHLHAGAASADGYVDEVIAPSQTRGRIIAALESLQGAIRTRRPNDGLLL